MTLCYIAEASSDNSCVKNLCRDHLAGGFVLDGLHDKHVVALVVLHGKSIALRNLNHLAFLFNLVPRESERSRKLVVADNVNFLGRTTANYKHPCHGNEDGHLQ